MLSDIPPKSVGESRKRKTTGSDPKNEDIEDSPQTRSVVVDTIPKNFNRYLLKKTMTHGLINLSLFSMNANQLRFILEHGSQATAPYYYVLAFCIILSLFLQVGVGVLSLHSSKYKVNGKEDDKRQEVFKYVDMSVKGDFLIAIVNV